MKADYGVMTILEKLHVIEDKKVVSDIHYCRAGVGFIFYEGPTPIPKGYDWRKDRVVREYYESFEKAVEEEWKKLQGEDYQ